MSSQERWCVVTGGRGFAARHLVEILIRYEMFCVRIADLGPSIKLEPYEEEGTLGKALDSGRVQYVSTDLRDKAQVLKGCLLSFSLPPCSCYINFIRMLRSDENFILLYQNYLAMKLKLDDQFLLFSLSRS